ncbi:MAG: hypothetical protein LBP79_01170 [Clostridiales bacterium]|nr:hypothetical protein [Clostridiales bacterium]
MNYGDIKKLNTVITENEYFENKIGAPDGTADKPPTVEKKRKPSAGLPRPNMSFIKGLKGKLDMYDAIMIPVGVGILAAFVMLVLKII